MRDLLINESGFSETFSTFIKTVREAQGLHLPSIRPIEAVCHQMELDPLFAIEKGFDGLSGTASTRRHVLEGRLAELSEDDLSLAIDFIDLLLAPAKRADVSQTRRPNRLVSCRHGGCVRLCFW
jgi:hypothetical protein